jgi:hypothetical protein
MLTELLMIWTELKDVVSCSLVSRSWHEKGRAQKHTSQIHNAAFIIILEVAPPLLKQVRSWGLLKPTYLQYLTDLSIEMIANTADAGFG